MNTEGRDETLWNKRNLDTHWTQKPKVKLIFKLLPVQRSEVLNSLSSFQLSRSVVSDLCDPIDISPPGSPVPGILQARTLEWVLIPLSHANSFQFSSVAQSCPTFFDPMDCSMPGFPVHHQLLEFAQTHVHQVADAIQPSHAL